MASNWPDSLTLMQKLLRSRLSYTTTQASARFVDELAEEHRIRGLLHLDAMTEEPDLAMTDEVVVDVRAGDNGQTRHLLSRHLLDFNESISGNSTFTDLHSYSCRLLIRHISSFDFLPCSFYITRKLS